MNNYFKLLLLSSFIVNPLNADTIVLKNGTTFEGNILSEDSTSYLTKVFVTKTIQDERRFLKVDVKEIIKEAPSEAAYKKLPTLIPTPDNLATSSYVQRIQVANDYLRNYPTSKHHATVSSALEVLQKEYAVISKKGLKLNGQLINAQDIQFNAYHVDALILLSEFKKLASQGQTHRALRRWDRLQEDYSNSSAFIDNIPLAIKVLQNYQNKLNQLLSTLDSRMMQRKVVLQSHGEDDRIRAEQDITQRARSYDTLIKKESNQLNTKWLTIDPFHEAALSHNASNAATELKNLEKLKRTMIKPVGSAYNDTWTALSKDELEKASKLLEELLKFKLPEQYTTPLATMLSEKKEMQKIKEMKMRAEEERLAQEAAELLAQEEKEMEMMKEEKKKKKKARAKK